MRAPRHINTEWPQTMQMRRVYYQAKKAEPIDWGRCLMVAAATFLVLVVMVYKFTGPV